MIPNVPNDIRFLILDDVASIRNMLIVQLQQMGQIFPPMEAETVQQALKMLESTQGTPKSIQFILSDWNLPDDTGLSFLKKVRANSTLDNVPFLMITTEDSISNMIDAVNAGATNYMVKPWEYEDFCTKVQGCWSLLRKTTAAAAPARPTTTPASGSLSTPNTPKRTVSNILTPKLEKKEIPEKKGFFSKLFGKK